MIKTAKDILEQVAWYGSYKRSGDEPEGPTLSPDQALKELEAIIRTEKLKLLAEVGERVVGEDELSYMVPPPLLDVDPSSARSGEDITYLLDVNTRNEARRREWEIAKIRYALRNEQRIELTKLEAEL